MLKVKHIFPDELYSNRHSLDEYLRKELSDLVSSEKTWMTERKQLIQRFQLNEFKELTEGEVMSLNWDTDQINKVIEETFQTFSQFLSFDGMRITVVPALPNLFNKDFPQPMWSNAFTNGPGNIIIAIPPQPDIDFFKYLLAHECHHASPENPIYNLSLSTFTLEEWFKMEGTAEYFSLSLYKDKRWWKDNLPSELEPGYWKECKAHLKSVDDNIKSPLCFGSRKKGIPVFAGYLFALKLVSNYVSLKQPKDIRELFRVEPYMFIECYERPALLN
jgi:uncharacterized protein YjaZ